MKKKILVIDDDNIYRKILHRLLCNQYSLMLAEDSQKAFSLIEQKDVPDLIIADLNMPGLTGPEMITKIKKKMNGNQTPIIVITGMDDDNIKKELMQIGISEYLTKPIQRNELKERIAYFLNR